MQVWKREGKAGRTTAFSSRVKEVSNLDEALSDTTASRSWESEALTAP